jgi:PncC family amidohydrolase
MDELQEAGRRVAELLAGTGRTVVAADSVTAGAIATALAAAPDASEWFRGSIVAYHTAMKRQLLGVVVPSVITAECAREMAEGALSVTGADLAVAVTGVGGPDPEEGMPAGTVYISAGPGDALRVFEHRFEGEPADVVRQAALQALRHLAEVG